MNVSIGALQTLFKKIKETGSAPDAGQEALFQSLKQEAMRLGVPGASEATTLEELGSLVARDLWKQRATEAQENVDKCQKALDEIKATRNQEKKEKLASSPPLVRQDPRPKLGGRP